MSLYVKFKDKAVYNPSPSNLQDTAAPPPPTIIQHETSEDLLKKIRNYAFKPNLDESRDLIQTAESICTILDTQLNHSLYNTLLEAGLYDGGEQFRFIRILAYEAAKNLILIARSKKASLDNLVEPARNFHTILNASQPDRTNSDAIDEKVQRKAALIDSLN